MSIGKKLRDMREAEGLTREEVADLLDIPVGTMKRFETGRIDNVGSETLTKYTQNPHFKKYTLWLMTGDTNEEAGQVSPSLSPDGSERISNHQSGQKAG